MINTKTKLCALIGNPVEHSISPNMHNTAFKQLGLNYVYLAFKVENIREAITGLKEIGFIGANITIPYKVEVIKHLDWVEETTKKIGAVNTVVNSNGILKGYNTDMEGFLKPLEEKTEIKGKKITLIGAGGAARAIAYGISQKEGKLTILNRTVEKAKRIAKEIKCKYGGLNELKRIDSEVLINATPIGMFPDVNKSIVQRNILKNMIVYDIVYNPIETKLLKEAKQQGCKTINGIEMFINQGAAAFELWTGEKAPIEIMKEAVIKNLRR
jgi:shikimate dehydrogenase